MAVHVARLNSAVTLILLTGLCFLIASLFTLNEARSPQTELSTELTDKLTVEQLLDTAESEYWFALADHGDTATIANGILYAKKALEKLPQECESPVPDKHCIRNSKRGEQLIADMSHQLAIYQDTLFGLFPVLSLVRGSILLSPDATGNYEAIDDPNATAILQAGSKLAELLNRLLPGYPSLHIVVTGFDWQGNRREDLEAEVLSLLQRSPRFYLHPGAEVEDIIHDEIGEQAALLYSRTGIIDQSILSTLTDAWHVDNIIGIQFTELYSTENKAFYKVTANVDGSGALASANGASALGLIHHANDKWIWSGLGHLLLLLSAVLVAWQLDPTLKGALLAIAGFLFGRLIPYAVLRYTIPLQPPTDALMLLSWWWVLLFTFSIVVLPIIGLRFATAKIPLIRRTLAKPNGEGRLGVMAFSVCAGTMAWCVWPVVAYFGEHHAIWRIALVLPASLLLSYLLGRTLDDTDLDYPLGQSNLLVVTSMIAPVGLLIAQAPFVYWLITMTVLFTALWFSLRRKERRRQTALQQDDEEGPFSIKSKAATVRPQELNVLWKRINENTTDSNIKWCHFHGSEPEICQAFALNIAKRALPQPAGSPRFPEVDLGKTVMHSGWEPFKELLNIDSDVRREAEGQSIFDEVLGLPANNAAEANPEETVFKRLLKEFDGRSLIVWIFNGINADQDGLLMNCLKSINSRLDRDKKIVVLSYGSQPLSSNLFDENLFDANIRKSAIHSTLRSSPRENWVCEEAVAPLNSAEMKALLEESVRGDKFLDEVIRLSSDFSGNRQPHWETVLDLLHEMLRTGHLYYGPSDKCLHSKIPYKEVAELVSNMTHSSERVKEQAAALTEAELRYLRLGICMGETFDAKAISLIFLDHVPSYTVLSDYQSLAEKTGWFFLVPDSGPVYKFYRGMFSATAAAAGLYLEGKRTILMNEGQQMLLQKKKKKLDKEPGYGVYALRLLDSIPNVSSKDVYSQGTRIFKTVATLGRDDLAQELLSSAAAKKLALCAEELGESAQLQALVLWMKAVIANQSYDETLCRDVVNQTENLFQNDLSAIPFEMLADLTFSRHILKEEHASYACRLIDEGEDRDDVLAAALGQLLLKPSGESAADAVTRMEDTIQSLEQHSDDAESCSVKAKLMNRQGSIQKGMASGQVEDPDEAMLGFSRAQQTIRKAIAARLRAPGKIDTTGLQMDYQTLGDTYVGWSKIAKSTHKLELLANAEAAYRMKLKYAQSSTRDLWGRVLGLCSLGDVLWMTARLVEPDNADLVPIGDELKSVFLESRQLSSESAPHHAQPQFQDRAKPWAYNMQCWALVRLCYSDIGSDTDRFRWKYVYDSIVPSCDRMLNATAMEEEGCDPNRPMNVIDASRTPIQTRLVFLPMEKCSLRQRLVGELWLGVGESAGEGVLNHQLEKGDSTAGLVLDNPQRAHSPLISDNPVIVTHSHPNLDAIAAIWLATRSVAKLPFSEFDRTLVERIARWNQGNVELTDALENSWEIAFYKALEECPDDAARVTLGMGMLDLSAFLACQREGYDWPSIAAALLDDYQRIDLKREEALFEEDVISSETLDLTRIPGLHNLEPSRILCLTDPHTSGTTIKFMAKRGKYAGSIVSRRLRKIAPIQVWRHWIRIDPDKGSLQGLDLLLDKHEAKELELVGHSADISLGSWHDWCGHDDNRADSPPIRVGDLVLRGSLLTPAQIRQILVEVYG